MPVALIFAPDTPPIIVTGQDDNDLLSNIVANRDTLPDVFTDAMLSDFGALKAFVDSLPAPSGIFATPKDAQDHQNKVQQKRDSKLAQLVQDHFGVSDREMTAILGLRDQAKDGAPVRKIRAGKTGISGPVRRAMAYALAYGQMTDAEQEKAIADAVGKSWFDV